MATPLSRSVQKYDMNATRLKKIGKWTGLVIGALVLIVGGYVGAKWIGSGSVYHGEPERLLPNGALLVIRAEKLQSNLASIDLALETLFERRPEFRKIENSPLWHDIFDGKPKTVSQLRHDLNSAIAEASNAVASIPMLGLDLRADFLAGSTVAALYPKSNGGSNFALLTRVTKPVDFGLGFSSFATGQQGNLTIASDELGLRLEPAGKPPMWMWIYGDVLAVTSERGLMQFIRASHAREEGTKLMDAIGEMPEFAAAEGHLKEVESVTNGFLRVYADLRVLREVQGPDPNHPDQRAEIDQLFDISPGMIRLSPEIMPSIRKVIGRAVDTRAFSMAAWSVALDHGNRLQIDQFLVADPDRVKSEFPQVVASWSAPAAPTDFLSFLPADTWFVGTYRQPFKDLRDAIKPGVGPDGHQQQDAVSTFLEALGDNAPVESVGIAMFGRSLSPDPKLHRERIPPPMVSPVALPGFALFMRWPGVTVGDAEALLRRQLETLGAQKVRAVYRSTPGGDQFVTFALTDAPEAIRWLADLACFAAADHLVFTYSVDHVAVAAMLSAARGASESLATASGTPWTLPELRSKPHSALVWLSPDGLNAYSKAVALVPEIGERTYDSNTPFGKELRELRMELAAELTAKEGRQIDWTGSEVDRALELKRREWGALRAPFEAKLSGNLSAITAIEDFTALTTTTLSRMHTRFVIRLK